MKKRMMIVVVVGALATFVSCTPESEKQEAVVESATEFTITVAEVNAAQQVWVDALVEIGRMHAAGEDYRAFAEQVLTDAYDFDDGRVFFRPTLAMAEQTFRKTKKGALAYFIGGDPDYPNDYGFALKPWVESRYDNSERGSEEAMVVGNLGIAMGNVYFKDKDGNEIYVDKTFVFRKTADGKVRIVVHKSALPYNP
jgi:hypothetical protein